MSTSTPAQVSARKFLIDSVSKRVETGEVASAILDLGVIPEGGELEKAAKHLSGQYMRAGGHGMSDSFRAVDRLSESQLKAVAEFFPKFPLRVFNAEDEAEYALGLNIFLKHAVASLELPAGLTATEALRSLNNTNFSIPEGWSKNRWKKAVRLASRMEEFSDRLYENREDREASIVSKSRLSAELNMEGLDDKTLSAIAYLCSRANRRSQFAVSSQSKAFDTIHEGLIKLLDEDSNWFEVAKVYPTGVAFRHLTGAQKGELLSVFFNRMVKYGSKLEELYAELPEFTQNEMITTTGSDTHRWNVYSGAYNTMRSAWINLSTFLGMRSVLREFLPGKAPRIMAADLVRLRAWRGENEHSDSNLFQRYPKPWEVISGEASIDLDEVSQYNGWGAPLDRVENEEPELEPTLVHGVVVASPALAELLRKSGAMAGAKGRSKGVQ